MKLEAITRLVVTQDELDELHYKGPIEDSSGWKMFGAGCIVLAKSTRRLLIPKRRSDVDNANLWSTFGGFIINYEFPKQAMLRNLEEQSGLPGGHPYSGGHTNGAPGMYPLMTYHDINAGFMYYNFLVVVDSEFQPRIGGTMQSAEWFNLGIVPEPCDANLRYLLSNTLTESTIRFRSAF
jgi:hypothetical protein